MHDRPCSASIVIAASGYEESQTFQTQFGEMRSRDGASLEFTTNDAEGIFDLWKKGEFVDSVPDDFHCLLVDPTLSQVEQTIRQLSIKLAEFPQGNTGLDLFFAGHGEKSSGDLTLKDGTLSPTRLLDLQSEEVNADNGGPRGIGVFLDSCYSGSFLVRLALELYPRSDFRLFEGLVSCLPDEESFELSLLEHGAFTYTFLNRGNESVEKDQFNRAILEQDDCIIAKGLQGLVGMIGNSTAYLTQGKQFSMDLLEDRITVPWYAEDTLSSTSTFESVCKNLTMFKHGQSSSDSSKGGG